MFLPPSLPQRNVQTPDTLPASICSKVLRRAATWHTATKGQKERDPYSRIPRYARQAYQIFLEVLHEYPKPTGVPKQHESRICLFFTCPPVFEDGQPPHPPLKRSRSASFKSRASRPRPPPGVSSWSVDSVGDPRLLVPPSNPLRSSSRLSPVTNAESTASEGARPHQTLRPDPRSPRTIASARLPGSTGPTKWPTLGAQQRPSPYPQQSVPIPRPRPPGASVALLPAARKSYSTTDGSSFMVPDSAKAARQQSLWRRRPPGAGAGNRVGGEQEIPRGTDCCRPPGTSLAGTCAELAAPGCLSAHSVGRDLLLSAGAPAPGSGSPDA